MPTSHPVTREELEHSVAAEAARAHALRDKPFSDVRDDAGHQYIDLVMEGGGTLGIALLGYIHVLEQAGLRFLGIGGTSAGAVSAIALAAAGRPAEPRVSRLVDELANMRMGDFIDGKDDRDDDARDAIYAWLGKRSKLVKAWQSAQVLDNLCELGGLNRGVRFHAWMRTMLRGFNGGATLTVGALRQRMSDAPPLWIAPVVLAEDLDVPGGPLYESLPDGRRRLLLPRERDHLCVIAADIATETRAELPRMAPMFWRDPDAVDVADLARASMSIPGFFAPFRVASLPPDLVRERWCALGWPAPCYDGAFLPKQHVFVDGGVLSNFPIAAFHASHRVPLRPTFGVQLQLDDHCHEIDDIFDVLLYAFDSARHALDADFIDRNPDYVHLVQTIDTHDIGWLDFDMSRETRLRLFRLGAEAAVRFLEGFDWPAYKRVRGLLRDADRITVEAGVKKAKPPSP